MVRLAATALCTLALSFAAPSFTAAKSAVRAGDEVCVISADNACPLASIPVSKTDGSTLIYPGGKTRCAYNDWSDPSTNFSTNATFFFQVFPTKEKKDTTKLLVYLQGGGACVDKDTCNFALQCGSQTFQPNALPYSEGVLNRSEPTNMFNDWNIVHVPYCTGDIHVGNASLVGKDQGFEVLLQKPKCMKQNMTTHLNGYENAISAIKWAVANYPDVTDLAFSGSSAGALGAQLLGKAVADMWKVEEKKIKYTVIADSYVGVVPEENPAGKLINFYGSCALPLSIPDKVVAMCLNNTGTVVEMLSPILKETETTNWLYIDSKADRTQRQFYELVRQGVLQFPFPDMISPDDFFKNMTAILDELKKESNKLTVFFIEGDKHVFLNKNNYTLTQRTETNEALGTVMRTVLGLPPAPAEGAATSAPAASGAAGVVSSIASLAVVTMMAVLAW